MDLRKIVGFRNVGGAASSEEAINLLDFLACLPPKRWSTLAKLLKSVLGDRGIRRRIIRYRRSGQGRKLLALEAEDIGNHTICIRPGKNKIWHTFFVP